MRASRDRKSGTFCISFSTAKFDLAGEPVNMNEIPGRPFLVWLRPLLERAGYEVVDEPATEDWGWYVEVYDANGGRFIVGASARPDERRMVDWTVTVYRWRTLSQWIRREQVLAREDPLLAAIERALESPEFVEKEVIELTRAGFWESLGSSGQTSPTHKAEPFFQSSPFMRWTLVPVLLAFAFGMPLAEDGWTPMRAALHLVLCGSALLYALALVWPARCAWAGRAVALLVFLGYVGYLVYEWFFTDAPLRPLEPRSVSSPGNALKGLLVIGLPALFFALRPRRSVVRSPVDDGGHP